MNFGYAGDMTALQAWELLSHNANSRLVDVRTPPEWAFVGVPDLSPINKKTVLISWKTFPNYEVNKTFFRELANQNILKDSPILFLCKTGGRSMDAAIAATGEGYSHCYNIEDGFEGKLDEKRHRGALSGWKASNLPWEQN